MGTYNEQHDDETSGVNGEQRVLHGHVLLVVGDVSEEVVVIQLVGRALAGAQVAEAGRIVVNNVPVEVHVQQGELVPDSVDGQLQTGL